MMNFIEWDKGIVVMLIQSDLSAREAYGSIHRWDGVISGIPSKILFQKIVREGPVIRWNKRGKVLGTVESGWWWVYAGSLC